MTTHEELEAVLDTHQQVLSVINVDVEFSFEGVMYQHAGFYADLVVFGVPVGLVSDWNTVPSVGVRMSKSLSDASDDPLGKDVRLLKLR